MSCIGIACDNPTTLRLIEQRVVDGVTLAAEDLDTVTLPVPIKAGDILSLHRNRPERRWWQWYHLDIVEVCINWVVVYRRIRKVKRTREALPIKCPLPSKSPSCPVNAGDGPDDPAA